MATRMVRVLMLVCLGLSEMTLGDYGFGGVSRPKIIIKPAGPSKQHQWLGHGGYGVAPYVPRPVVIPKWNVMDPSYTAFWIANTPAPSKSRGNSQGSKYSGFGPPKQNSIISGSATGGSYAKPAASAPLPAALYSAPLPAALPSAPLPAALPYAPLPAALPVLRGPPPHSPLPLAITSAPAPDLTSPPAPIGSNSQIKASPPASKTPSTISDSSYSHL